MGSVTGAASALLCASSLPASQPCVLHVCPSSQAAWTGDQGGLPTKSMWLPLPAPGLSAPWCWVPALCGRCRRVPGPMVGGGQRGRAASPEWPPQARAPVLGVVPPGGPGPLGVSWGRKWLAAPWPGRKRGAQGLAGTRVPRCSSVRSRRGPTATSQAHCGDFMGSSQGHKGDVSARHGDPPCCGVLGCGPSVCLPSLGAPPASPAQLWRPLLPRATHCSPCCPRVAEGRRTEPGFCPSSCCTVAPAPGPRSEAAEDTALPRDPAGPGKKPGRWTWLRAGRPQDRAQVGTAPGAHGPGPSRAR